MMRVFRIPAIAGLVALLGTAAASAQAPAPWLDRAMTRWNQPGGAMPAAPAGPEARQALVRRCNLVAAKDATAADAAVAKAGWLPFLHVDRRIVRDDVEIVGGMTAATTSCEPAAFNLFVFVGGMFAGTIAPTTMTSRRDGAVGAVRITGGDAVTAEFSRYTSTDPDCCPSSVVRVTYRIERTGGRPTVVAVEARPVRG